MVAHGVLEICILCPGCNALKSLVNNQFPRSKEYAMVIDWIVVEDVSVIELLTRRGIVTVTEQLHHTTPPRVTQFPGF
jgi:hypothetical protein